MPIFPYITALMYSLGGGNKFIQIFLIGLPIAIADSLVPIVIYLLFKSFKGEKIAFRSSMIYALNPISLLLIASARWDGLTLLLFLLGLVSISKNQTATSGFWAGFGYVTKQFPISLLLVFLLKTKSIRLTIIMSIISIAVTVIVLSPFLINCPATFFDNIFGHQIWRGHAGEKVGIGTIKNVFDHLGIPYAKIIWGVLFASLLGIPSLKADRRNYIYYAGILMVTLAFFTYVTHRHLLVWCMPFIILITLERKNYIPFILFFVGYAIRLIKPDWYFGLIHLGVGVWYYLALYRRMISGHLRQYLH